MLAAQKFVPMEVRHHHPSSQMMIVSQLITHDMAALGSLLLLDQLHSRREYSIYSYLDNCGTWTESLLLLLDFEQCQGQEDAAESGGKGKEGHRLGEARLMFFGHCYFRMNGGSICILKIWRPCYANAPVQTDGIYI